MTGIIFYSSESLKSLKKNKVAQNPEPCFTRYLGGVLKYRILVKHGRQ